MLRICIRRVNLKLGSIKQSFFHFFGLRVWLTQLFGGGHANLNPESLTVSRPGTDQAVFSMSSARRATSNNDGSGVCRGRSGISCTNVASEILSAVIGYDLRDEARDVASGAQVRQGWGSRGR